MLIRALALIILMSSKIVLAGGIIRIYEAEEIENAHKLNTMLHALPNSIVDCLDASSGDIESCACADDSECKSRAALLAAREHFCKVKRLYPDWVDVSPNYMLENDPRGFALHMPSMSTRLGKTCN